MKNSHKSYHYVLAVLAAIAVSCENSTAQIPLNGTQILLNGSFESPMNAPNTYQISTPSHWTWDFRDGHVVNGNAGGPTFPLPLPEDGQQYILLGDNDTWSISQNIAVPDPGSYRLSWYDNAYACCGQQSSPYIVRVYDDSHQTVASLSLNAWHDGVWANNALDVNLAAGSYFVQFQALGPTGTADTLLDNVAFTPVPEPASIGLMALAAGVAVSLCRRNRHLHKSSGKRYAAS